MLSPSDRPVQVKAHHPAVTLTPQTKWRVVTGVPLCPLATHMAWHGPQLSS